MSWISLIKSTRCSLDIECQYLKPKCRLSWPGTQFLQVSDLVVSVTLSTWSRSKHLREEVFCSSIKNIVSIRCTMTNSPTSDIFSLINIKKHKIGHTRSYILSLYKSALVSRFMLIYTNSTHTEFWIEYSTQYSHKFRKLTMFLTITFFFFFPTNQNGLEFCFKKNVLCVSTLRMSLSSLSLLGSKWLQLMVSASQRIWMC